MSAGASQHLGSLRGLQGGPHLLRCWGEGCTVLLSVLLIWWLGRKEAAVGSGAGLRGCAFVVRACMQQAGLASLKWRACRSLPLPQL